MTKNIRINHDGPLKFPKIQSRDNDRREKGQLVIFLSKNKKIWSFLRFITRLRAILRPIACPRFFTSLFSIRLECENPQMNNVNSATYLHKIAGKGDDPVDKKQEFLIIFITCILLVFTLYIFRGFIPMVSNSNDIGMIDFIKIPWYSFIYTCIKLCYCKNKLFIL